MVTYSEINNARSTFMRLVQSNIISADADSGWNKSRSAVWQLKRIKEWISWQLSHFMNIYWKNQKGWNKSPVYVHFRFNFDRTFHIVKYLQLLQALVLNFYIHLKNTYFSVNVEATTTETHNENVTLYYYLNNILPKCNTFVLSCK